MSIGDPSRENEPSAFAWIFGGLLSALAAVGLVWGVRANRRGPADVAHPHETPGNHQQ